mmetsp:Transcript_12608/g.29650  ORF Transcript_12608/g.29650 Transcript_12608/m.29650 type:complete len:274 (+) Transcript_12608:563-1384(+)
MGVTFAAGNDGAHLVFCAPRIIDGIEVSKHGDLAFKLLTSLGSICGVATAGSRSGAGHLSVNISAYFGLAVVTMFRSVCLLCRPCFRRCLLLVIAPLGSGGDCPFWNVKIFIPRYLLLLLFNALRQALQRLHGNSVPVWLCWRCWRLQRRLMLSGLLQRLLHCVTHTFNCTLQRLQDVGPSSRLQPRRTEQCWRRFGRHRTPLRARNTRASRILAILACNLGAKLIECFACEGRRILLPLLHNATNLLRRLAWVVHGIEIAEDLDLGFEGVTH